MSPGPAGTRPSEAKSLPSRAAAGVDVSDSGLGRYLLDAVGLRPGEHLALIADSDRVATARTLVREARRRGAEASVVVTSVDYRTEETMPADAVAATDRGDVVLLLVSAHRAQFGGHADFRKRATARDARLGFVINDTLPGDPKGLTAAAARTRALAAMLTEADRAQVRSEAGTALELDIRGRSGTPITPELAEPAAWGALPDYMEAAIAPREGSAEGRLVVDGTCTHSGVQTSPMVLELRGGEVTSLRGGSSGQLEAYLDGAGKAGRNVAELGIGTNDLVGSDQLIGTFVDKRIAGTAHIGLGDNRSLGGETTASIHTDVQLLGATVELDGRRVVDGGRILL